MLDRRRQRRTRAYLGGQILTGHRPTAIDCLIRNMSGTGAKLVVATGALLPEEFDLHVPKTQNEFRVRIRWRHNEEVGVEVAPAAAVSVEVAGRLKRLEAENAALKQRLGDTR